VRVPLVSLACALGCGSGSGQPADATARGDGIESGDGAETSCPVANARGIVNQGDALWTGTTIEPLVFDFDGDKCPDGMLQIADGQVVRKQLDGTVVWTSASPVPINGGIAQLGDYSGDGIIDIVAVAYAPIGSVCGTTPRQRSHLLFINGGTGAVEQPASPLDDICWTFGTTMYPTVQYYPGSVVLADYAPTRAGLEAIVFPYYATLGFVLSRSTGAWQMLHTETDPTYRHLYYPSTVAFDNEYAAVNQIMCKQSAWNPSGCWIDNSHVANPVMLAGASLLLLTSGRAVTYRTNLGPTGDYTWTAGGRTDHAGRNYGLVTRFVDAGTELVTLHGGCSAAAMRGSMRAGSLDAGDALCGIHRHYEVFTINNGVVNVHASRFYGYAASPGLYEGRLQFPRRAVFTTDQGYTLTAYSLYTGGRWEIRIADPQAVDTPAQIIPSAFLWDVRDVDGDQDPDLIVSALPTGVAADTTASLVPPWTTSIYKRGGGLTFTVAATLDGAAPALAQRPNLPTLRSSEGALASAVVTDLEHDDRLELVLEKPDGTLAVAHFTGTALAF